MEDLKEQRFERVSAFLLPYICKICVTVRTGLRIYCADRKNMIQVCKNPIAEGNFQWIFASYWSRSEQ